MSELPTPSTQPVPAQYEHNPWDIPHGTNLEEHNEDLTPEQAQQINDNYDIVLHGGGHGKFENGTSVQVFDADYDAAAGVVEAMQPDDVLFLEGFGFKTAEAKPVLQSFADMGVPEKQAILQKMREARKISPWDYAIELAGLKGITAINADIDALQTEKAKAAGFLNTEKNVEIGPDENGKYLDERIHAWRNQTAYNIVKDWALAHLPPAHTPPPERKRGLHVLYGLTHLNEIRELFEERNLHVTTERLNVEAHKAEMKKNLLALMSIAGALMTQQTMPGSQDKTGQEHINDQ